tara:strand:- start:2046 stop:2504 length:459 start_codon:yes stop_codon:yes gene_type:complete
MSTIVTPYLTKLDSIELELPNIARQTVIDNQEEIKDLLKYKQLALGKGSDGESLGVYSQFTQSYADRDGLSIPKTKGQPYNFQWSSDTFNSMGLFATKKGEFDIFSIDGKKDLLESIYGEIFDLTEEHNQYVNIEIILPTLQQYILDNLTLI